MKYDEVEKEIERVKNSDFTIDDIHDIVRIVDKIGEAAYEELPEELRYFRPPLDDYRADPRGKVVDNHYENTIERLKKVVFNKIKEKIDASDVTIDNIVNIIFSQDKKQLLKGIYAIDNEYIIGSYGTCKGRVTNRIGSYKNIGFSSFSEGVNEQELEEFTSMLDNFVRTLPIEVDNDDKMVYVNTYNYPRSCSTNHSLNICLNHTLKEIMSDKEGKLETKLIIATYDMLYSFNLKYVNEKFEIYNNNDVIIDVVQELEKERVK